MALSLPLKFANDIKGNTTNLVPLVTIESPTTTTEGIYLSTHLIDVKHAGNKDGFFSNPFHFKPLLLNISPLKESIDIEKRKYKISNITLSISNLPYEGVRFSERVLSTDHDSVPNTLINTSINIQWKSPRSKYFTSFNPIATGSPFNGVNYYEYYKDDNDICLMVYSGIIRKYTHDDTTVTLSIEDRTELDFHQDLPIQNDDNWLSTGNQVPEKYRGKPKPMVYGYIDKSPCVVDANGQVVIDSKPIHNLIKRTHDVFGEYEPLYMAAGDSILSVAKEVERDLGSVIDTISEEDDETISGGDYIEVPQWTHENNGNDPADNIIQLNIFNPLVVNQVLQCDFLHKATSVFIDDNTSGGNINMISEEEAIKTIDNDYSTGTNINHSAENNDKVAGQAQDLYKDTFFEMRIGTKPSVEDSLESKTTSIAINSVKLPIPQKVSGHSHAIYLYPIKHETESSDNYYSSVLIGHEYSLKESNPDASGFEYDLTTLFGFPELDGINDYDYDTGGTSKDIDIILTSITTEYTTTTDEEGEETTTESTGSLNNNAIIPSLWCYDNCGMGDHSDTPNNGYYDIFFRVHANISGMNDGDKYRFNMTLENANINEVDVRTYVDIKNIYDKKYFATVRGRRGTNPANHYLRQPTEIITDIIREIKNDPNYEPEKRGFSSGYESLHNGFINDFTVHKKIGSKKLIENILATTPFIGRFANNGNFVFNEIPYNGGTPLHTIKEEDVINFSFSRTETIYTKVILKSKINYLTEEFEHITEVLIDDVWWQGYYSGYYGLPEDHSASTLVIDDDRGKYIRNKDAAERLAFWLLSYYGNAHLRFKIDLPLRYLNVEVGDIINFNKLIQGIKPYGINYVKDYQYINGQNIFPTFIVTSTSKSLDKVTIECEQNHLLVQERCGWWVDHSGYDCLSECNGTATVDVCGVCDGGETDLENCVDCPDGLVDCLGVCGGTAVRDECGVCEGTCFNLWMSEESWIDNCDYECGCEDIPEGYCDCDFNVEDCAGICGGDSFIDNCGECIVQGIDQECQEDCFGEYGGTASNDVCGYCTEEGTDVDECWNEFYIKVEGNGILKLKKLYIELAEGCALDVLKGQMYLNGVGNISDQQPPDQDWQSAGSENNESEDTRIWKGYQWVGGNLAELPMSGGSYTDQYLDGRTQIRANMHQESDCAITGWDIQFERPSTDPVLLVERPTPYHILRLPRYLYRPFSGQSVDYEISSPIDINIDKIQLWHKLPDGISMPLHDAQDSDGNDLVTYEKTHSEVSWSKYEGTKIQKHIITVKIPEGTDNGLIGDVNNDGMFNVLDIVSLVNVILEGGTYFDSGDVNGDGSLNVLDVVKLANCVLSGIHSSTGDCSEL